MDSLSQETTIETPTIIATPSRVQVAIDDAPPAKGIAGRLRTRTARLSATLTFTTMFFLVELIVGNITRSTALIADSFHMLSDIIALIIGVLAIRFAKRHASEKNTFGWTRLETVGALVNGVFMMALCLSIIISAIERLFRPEEIEDPVLLLIVGGVGLGINILGMLFMKVGSGHGHSHGGDAGSHGHSHGGDENMKAVFIHVAGDALGSIAVIISATIVWLVVDEWTIYVDPILSLLIAAILLSHTIPLVKRTSLVLLQAVPTSVRLDELKKQLLNIPGIAEIHELHIWQLAGNKIIASVHITVSSSDSYMQIAAGVKRLFHQYGIHSTTVQPEYIDDTDEWDGGETACLLKCAGNENNYDCAKDNCCTGKGMSLTNLSRVTTAEPANDTTEATI